MTSPRECGSCTECCHLMAVSEIGKPIFQWCKFCNTNTGCTIYDKRPHSCRGFQCLWLKDESIPDDMRPDRCGVLLEDLSEYRLCLGLCSENRPDAWLGPKARAIFSSIAARGITVGVSVDGGRKRYLLLPFGRTPSDILDDIKRAWIHVEECNGVASVHD